MAFTCSSEAGVSGGFLQTSHLASTLCLVPVQAFESSRGKVGHQGGGFWGAGGKSCVQLGRFSAVLCMVVRMVVQVESAGEDGTSNSLNLALQHVSNSVGFLFGPRK